MMTLRGRVRLAFDRIENLLIGPDYDKIIATARFMRFNIDNLRGTSLADRVYIFLKGF